MVEYRLQHPKNRQKFSIKKWLYLRYVYHHSIEEIGRGIYIYIYISGQIIIIFHQPRFSFSANLGAPNLVKCRIRTSLTIRKRP